MAQEHHIERLDDEAVMATPEGAAQPLLLVRGPGARIFRRRAQRFRAEGGPVEAISWLVGELDGVKLYFDGEQMVLTKQELYP